MKVYIFLLFSLLFSTTFSFAQEEKYTENINSFTTEDGLSHLEVYCFEKDSKGVLWIGTRDGLNRFDGKKFKVFTKKDGLGYQNINTLYRDGDFLWCIHHDRGVNLDFLSIFHVNEEKVYSLNEYLGENIPFNQSDIELIKKVNKALVICTKDDKKYFYSTENGLKSIPFIKKNEEIKGILPNGDFWILDLGKEYLHLRRVNKDGKQLILVENKEIPLSKTSFIHQTKDDIAYFGYYESKEELICKLLVDKKGKVTLEKPIFIDKNKITLNHHFSQFYSKYNAYWHSILGALALVSFDNKILYKTFTDVSENNATFIDGNTLWIPHQTGGFFQLEIQKNKFAKLDLSFQSGFRGINKLNDTFYISSDFRMFSNDTKLGTYNMHKFLGYSTLVDKESIWAFKFRNLIKYTAKLEPIRVYSINQKEDTMTWSMYQDKNGLIWYSDIGLKVFNPKTEELQEITSNEFPEIGKGITYHFYEKEDGNILLCTTTGLYEMEFGKGIVARYWSGGKGKYYLPTDDFRHLYFDKSTESYWLATNEGGLIHWQPQDNISKSYKFNHYAANIIHAVYSDECGFLWLSTENGIIQFEKSTADFRVFLPKDGTSTHEFNRISHFQDEDGTIYFGGIKGVTTFDPKYFYQNFNSIENTKIITVEINQYKDETKKAENVTSYFFQKKQLDFYSKDRFLTFIFGLDDYRYSKDAIYYFKLKNIDKDWTITKNNEITISGMPYGEQILEVRALLENGKFTKGHVEILIIVHKPFYLQWWFFVLLFSIIASFTLFYIRYRTRKLELQKITLENEVKKRTLKIEKDKEVIENDKQIIEKQAEKLIELDKTKTRFFANISHELRTPITLIKSPIQSIIKTQKLSERNEFLLNIAAKNTDNLLNLINEILDLTKLDNQKLELKESGVIFYTFIKQILSNFQSIAEMQKIEMTLQYQTEKELRILLDKGKFQKILNNLLSNALKFTPPNGEIVISVQDLGANILMKVQDNGRGIPEVDIPHVFERYFQSSQNNKAEGGLGIGLALGHELIKLFGGKMWVESSTKKENQGTVFFVEFPKKEILNRFTTKDVLNQEDTHIHDKSTFLNRKVDKTILIVEDNKDLRDYLRFILSVEYKILTAENGKKALEIVSESQVPNLIISDLMMPIMDGHELLEAVKSTDDLAGIPFIMLTARAILKDKLKALRVGVDDYITKPFEEEELLIRINNLLKNHDKRVFFVQKTQKKTPVLQEIKEKKSTLSISSEDKKWLESFENLVLENLRNSLFSIDYLAELIQVDRKTLYKKIKTLTGLTPNQYIKAIRLKLAKDFLEKGKYKTIKEVTDSVGFKSATHFSNIFKKEYGKSPSSYLL